MLMFLSILYYKLNEIILSTYWQSVLSDEVIKITVNAKNCHGRNYDAITQIKKIY